MKIHNTSVLITGGSRGLGRALARALAAEGARVVLVARRAKELNDTVGEIRSAGGEAYGIAADVADKNATYAIAGAAAAVAGPIDILIQNASTLGPVPLRLLLDTDCEDLQHALDVNLIGPFRLAKPVVGSMALRGTGLVLSITSDASVEAYPGWGAYSITKAALDKRIECVIVIAAIENGFLEDRGVGRDTRDATGLYETTQLAARDEVSSNVIQPDRLTELPQLGERA